MSTDKSKSKRTTGSRMTLHVYRITATGKRVTITPKHTVRGEPGFFRSRLFDQWPECACPRHARTRPS